MKSTTNFSATVNRVMNFDGMSIKFHNWWGKVKQEVNKFVSQIADTNKMVKALFFLLYTVMVVKLAIILAVILMDVIETAAEDTTLMELPIAFWQEVAARVQMTLIGYSPVQQIGICILAFALLNVLISPAALWLDFSLKTIFSSGQSRQEKYVAIRDEACRLFDLCASKLDRCCSGIVKIAGCTFIVWIVWNLLCK